MGLHETFSSRFSLRFLLGLMITVISLSVLLVGTLLLYARYQIVKEFDLAWRHPILEIASQLTDSPDSPLSQQIRELDLRQRQIYFSWQIFLNRGLIVLLIAGTMTLLGLRLLWKERYVVLTSQEEKVFLETLSLIRERGILILTLLTGGLLMVGILLIWSWQEYLTLKRENSPQKMESFTQSIGSNLSELKEDVPHSIRTPMWVEQCYQNWPAFRGWDGNGISPVLLKTDEVLSQEPDWIFQPALEGFSSPIIWDDKVFVTCGDAQQFLIYALDLFQGRVVWQSIIPTSRKPEVSPDTGYAASTPVTNGKFLWAISAHGTLVCLDTSSGNVVWKHEFENIDIMYGYASSLRYDGQYLYVLIDDDYHPRLLIMNPQTGQIWKQIDRHQQAPSWGTPSIIYNHHSDEIFLIVNGNPKVIAYRIAVKPEILWEWEGMNGELAVSPTANLAYSFVAQDHAVATMLETQTGRVLWIKNDIPLPDVPSPLLYNDKIYLPTSAGTGYCLDARTGTVIWQYEFENLSYASPIAVNQTIVWIEKTGKLHLLKAESNYHSLLSCQLPSSVVATPAVCRYGILIRTTQSLLAYLQKEFKKR